LVPPIWPWQREGIVSGKKFAKGEEGGVEEHEIKNAFTVATSTEMTSEEEIDGREAPGVNMRRVFLMRMVES